MLVLVIGLQLRVEMNKGAERDTENDLSYIICS